MTYALIFLLVGAVYLFGLRRAPKEMAVAVAGMSIALFFVNLESFTRFSALGVVADLNTAVKKAYAAIDQLRELGPALSKPIVDEMAPGSMVEYWPLKSKLERVEAIEASLRKLGASSEEISKVTANLYGRVIRDHILTALSLLRSANPGKESLFKGLEDGKMDDIQDINKFIKDNGLKTNREVEEAVEDLNYFRKNKRLRREEGWQG